MKNILMNTEMTKAILDGRKVQTRRVVKGDFSEPNIEGRITHRTDEVGIVNYEPQELFKRLIEIYSKYQIGETIWVREPAKIYYCNRDYMKIRAKYLADEETIQLDIPSRFCKQTKDGWLPNWMRRKKGIPNGCIKEMARIFLKVTNVRVERLQDISAEEIHQEGTDAFMFSYPRMVANFINEVWNSTAPKGYKWEDNPYVFVYEFERVEK